MIKKNIRKRYNNLTQEKDLNLNSFDLRRNEYDIQKTKEINPRNSSIKLPVLNHETRRRSISSNNLEIFEHPNKRNSSSSPYKGKKKRVSTEFDEISNNLDKISILDKKIAPIINMDSDIEFKKSNFFNYLILLVLNLFQINHLLLLKILVKMII